MRKCFQFYNDMKSVTKLTIQQRISNNLQIICNYFQLPQHPNGTHVRNLLR
jgi:hypothetical protein